MTDYQAGSGPDLTGRQIELVDAVAGRLMQTVLAHAEQLAALVLGQVTQLQLAIQTQAMEQQPQPSAEEVAAELVADVLEESVRAGASLRDGVYDSSGISTFADQMRRLAELGRFVITKEPGPRRVMGRFVSEGRFVDEQDG